jgi:hypothetical protein
MIQLNYDCHEMGGASDPIEPIMSYSGAAPMQFHFEAAPIKSTVFYTGAAGELFI